MQLANTSSRWLVGLMALALPNAAEAQNPPLRLVPPPKQVQWSGEPAFMLKAGSVAIMVGDQASEPEQYAARMLQANVWKRLGQDWPVVSEGKDRKVYDTVVLLGERGSHRLLDEVCLQNRIDLSDASPGLDGYVIEMLNARGPGGARAGAGKEVVLVGGSNPRGVVYGQDTLFQLLSRRGGDVALARASIRDWPSIPWRGRPQTSLSNYFREGELDCYMTARINWIDLREGTYAVDPGTPLEKDKITKVVSEAHRRGLIIYAVVNCGVPASRYDAVLDTYKEFITLGADGLWLSFDDKGPGEYPEQLVFRVLDLARSHGITGPRIMINPPKGSYQTIADASNGDFNRKIMAIPGMEQALWTWTRPPTPESLAEARSIGLKARLGWWHNWTRPGSGFTHVGSGSMVLKGRPYLEIPSLREGWSRPSYDLLASAGECTDMVMPWGGNTWGPFYVVPVIGWWSWCPEKHDWNATRSRIYDIVYGPDQVPAAMAFDDGLITIHKLFCYNGQGSTWEPSCPPRLTDLANREQALRLLSQLDQLQERIAEGAAGQTMLDAVTMKDLYLDPMATEIALGKAAAGADYPEYEWPAHQRKLLAAVYDGKLGEADQLAANVRANLLRNLDQIAASLAGLTLTNDYVNWWKHRVNLDGKGWRDLMQNRHASIAPKVWEYGYFSFQTSKMLEGITHPPLRWGFGGATQQNRVLATVLPSGKEQFWGKWMGGICRTSDAQVAVFYMGREGTGTLGGYSELPIEIPISGQRDRLGVLFYLCGHNRESLGLETVPNRWGGYRIAQLLLDSKLLWQADIGVQRTRGEWFMVNLPPVPDNLATLTLRLRVEDILPNAADALIMFSPFRLIEMTE